MLIFSDAAFTPNDGMEVRMVWLAVHFGNSLVVEVLQKDVDNLHLRKQKRARSSSS